MIRSLPLIMTLARALMALTLVPLYTRGPDNLPHPYPYLNPITLTLTVINVSPSPNPSFLACSPLLPT